MPGTVAVLGGGVAGLSAAHELAERGFSVTVYESSPRFGGKARSYGVRGSGTDGRHDLPAEHGFRFFPGFYRHLPDTMKRIPGPRAGHHVFDELVAADRMMLARENGANELITAAHAPASLDDFAAVTQFMFTVCTRLGISAEDQAFFVDRLLVLLTSCDERRYGQWEKQSWWEFVDAENRSPGFRRFLADGLTRMLVAAQAQEISARTGGYILLQLIFDLSRAGGHADRLLDGPTSEVWIDPWVAHLRGAGVDLRTDSEVDGIDCAHGRIAGVTVDHHGTRETVTADHYVAAMPVEQLRPLLSHELVSGRAAPGGDAPAAHALDERGHVLPAPRRADPGRAHDLQRLRLGADLDLAAPVLAAHRLRAASATGTSAASSRSTCPTGSARRGARARWPRSAAPTRSRPRYGRSSRTTSTTPGTSSSTTPTSRAPSSTRTSPSPTRARPRTPSRCSSTPPARGPTGPRR